MPGIESSTGGITYGSGDFYTYILNDLFLPTMADTVIYPNALLKRLPRDSTRVEGKNVVFPIHTDDSLGVAALGGDGLLPEAGTEAYLRYSFGVKHLYVRMKFDGITMDATRTQLASWLKVVESEAKGKANILARQRQRMYHNDGSGRYAEIAAGGGVGAAISAAASYNVVIPQDIESASTCTSTATRFLKLGQIVAIVSADGATIRGTGIIDVITATTIEFSSVNAQTGNVTAGDYVVSASQSGVTVAAKDIGWRNEPMGLAGILQDSDLYSGSGAPLDFQGIDGANTWHRANVLSNGGVLRPLTLSLMDQAWTRSIEIGDAVPTVVWASFPLVRAYADLLIADRRFVGTRTFDGGYDALDYNGVPLLADRDMYNNRLYMPDETDMRMYVMSDPTWMNFDGSIYHRLTDKDAYQATMYCRETMGVDTRDRHTIVTDIAE
jgi:hypothetical protein